MSIKKGQHVSVRTEFKKGHKMSEKVRKKISKKLKGRKPYIITKKTRKKMRKAKLKNPTKYWLGKKRPEISAIGKANKGKKRTEQVKKKMSKMRLGEKHWNWQGGITKQYDHRTSTRRYKKWRSDVFERDNWTCQTCRKRGCYLEAHHIKSWSKYLKLRYIVSNGVTLCKECHSLTDNYRGKANKRCHS